MTKKEEIKQFLVENPNYSKIIPLLIQSMGLSYKEYSRRIGKSPQWLSHKLDGSSAPLKLIDFKRLQLFFSEMFPNTNFEDFAYRSIIDKYSHYSKAGLLNELNKRDKEIKNLKSNLNNTTTSMEIGEDKDEN